MTRDEFPIGNGWMCSRGWIEDDGTQYRGSEIVVWTPRRKMSLFLDLESKDDHSVMKAIEKFMLTDDYLGTTEA